MMNARRLSSRRASHTVNGMNRIAVPCGDQDEVIGLLGHAQ